MQQREQEERDHLIAVESRRLLEQEKAEELARQKQQHEVCIQPF